MAYDANTVLVPTGTVISATGNGSTFDVKGATSDRTLVARANVTVAGTTLTMGIQISKDNTNWVTVWLNLPITAVGVYYMEFSLPAGYRYARTTYTAITGSFTLGVDVGSSFP